MVDIRRRTTDELYEALRGGMLVRVQYRAGGANRSVTGRVTDGTPHQLGITPPDGGDAITVLREDITALTILAEKHSNDLDELVAGDFIGVQYVTDGVPHEVRGRVTHLGEDIVEVGVPDITGQDFYGSKVTILRESITLLRILDRCAPLEQSVAWTILGEPVRRGDLVAVDRAGLATLTDRVTDLLGGSFGRYPDAPAQLHLGTDPPERVIVGEITAFRNLTYHGEEWHSDKVVFGHTPLTIVFYGGFGAAYAWNGNPDSPWPEIGDMPLVDRAVFRALAANVIAEIDRAEP